MSFRSMCKSRFTIERKGSVIHSADDNGYSKVIFQKLNLMIHVPGTINSDSSGDVFKMEGVDTRSSDRISIVARLDNGTPVDIKRDDRLIDEDFDEGTSYRVLDLKASQPNGILRSYSLKVVEEGSWLIPS